MLFYVYLGINANTKQFCNFVEKSLINITNVFNRENKLFAKFRSGPAKLGTPLVQSNKITTAIIFIGTIYPLAGNINEQTKNIHLDFSNFKTSP